MPKKKETRTRRTIEEEIQHTLKEGDMHASVAFTISMTRGLWLHSQYATRDGDYASVSAYISDLIRRDKHESKNPLLALLRFGSHLPLNHGVGK